MKRRRNNKQTIYVCEPPICYIEITHFSKGIIKISLKTEAGLEIFNRKDTLKNLGYKELNECVRDFCEELTLYYSNSKDTHISKMSKNLMKVTAKSGLNVWKRRKRTYK